MPGSRTAPMAGGGAYNRNSSVQAVGLMPGVALLRQAAASVRLPDPPQPVVVADYGCSTGRNSLAPMAAAIEALRARATRPISVVHTDLPDNDFPALFDTLSHDPDSYTFHPDVFPMAIGRSFYGQLLPAGSVTLGWSSWSVAWLSRSPVPVPDHIHVSYSADAAARSAYAARSARDWEDFITARSAEMHPGARLVVVVPAASDDGSAGYRPMFDAAWDSLCRCVAEGLLSADEAVRMVMPHFGRNTADLEAPFGGGRFAGLAIDHLEAFNSADPFWQDYQSDRDKAAFGAGWAGVFAAGAIPSLMTGLAGGPGDPRAAKLARRLEADVAARLADAPGPMRIPLANVVLVKESAT